jgi:protein involved in polysaccharide export with SLBB domain
VKTRRLPALAALLILLAGCAPGGPHLVGGAASGDAPGGVALAPEHTLSAGDEFEIRLPFADDYNDRVTVGMDGTVAPKAIGSVLVGGLTVPEATVRLKARYATLLKAPDLSITVRRYAPEVIYVDGWVARPGLIRSDIPMTVARALAQVGGVKAGAKTSDVLIMRHDPQGGVQTYQVALGNFAGAGAEDPMLKAFDVVYVPQTPLAAVADFARQYYRNLPFSASLQLRPLPVPTIAAPQLLAPAPAAPVITR